MGKIIIPGRLVNKANCYEVRVNPSLWQRIKPAVEAWRAVVKQSPWWIAPSKAVEAYEAEVAYRILAGERREWLQGENLQLTVRLIRQLTDIDGCKGVLDGIQRSGRIKNDRQFRRLILEHQEGKLPAVELEIAPLGDP